jgi:hypothetical protein
MPAVRSAMTTDARTSKVNIRLATPVSPLGKLFQERASPLPRKFITHMPKPQ